MTLGTFGSLFPRTASQAARGWMASTSSPGHSFKADGAVNRLYASTEWIFPVFGHITAQTTTTQPGGGIDIMSILLFVMLGIFIFMMFRRNKKTQQQQATLQSQFAPGVEVMTSFGLFGRIVDIDDEENKVTLELSPGNLATVHRQAVTKIVEPAAGTSAATDVPDDASSLTGAESGSTAAAAETPDETLKRLNDEGKKDS
jgi:preprotein translocase subunit YajC